MSLLRREDELRIRSSLEHNPPDEVNFGITNFSGEKRQVYNYCNFLKDEFQFNGIWSIFKTRENPSVPRPDFAYDRIEDGTDNKEDREKVRDYESYKRRQDNLILKGRQIIQLSVTSNVYDEYKRELRQLRKETNPVLSEREIFIESFEFFAKYYSGKHQIQTITSMITREMQQIPPITNIQQINELISKLHKKNEQFNRIAYWERDKKYKLSDDAMQATLFSKLLGEKIATSMFMLHTYCDKKRRNFRDITKYLQNTINHHSLDSIDQKQAYSNKSETSLSSSAA